MRSVGVIASVTKPFCGDCTRARISAEGKLYTCLFAVRGTDLRALLRSGATDEELSDAVAGVWTLTPGVLGPRAAAAKRCRALVLNGDMKTSLRSVGIAISGDDMGESCHAAEASDFFSPVFFRGEM